MISRAPCPMQRVYRALASSPAVLVVGGVLFRSIESSTVRRLLRPSSPVSHAARTRPRTLLRAGRQRNVSPRLRCRRGGLCSVDRDPFHLRRARWGASSERRWSAAWDAWSNALLWSAARGRVGRTRSPAGAPAGAARAFVIIEQARKKRSAADRPREGVVLGDAADERGSRCRPASRARKVWSRRSNPDARTTST